MDTLTLWSFAWLVQAAGGAQSCQEGDDDCDDDDDASFFVRYYNNIVDYFTDFEEKDEDDLKVDEDIDLWELFQCWLWGEKLETRDDNDHVTDAKHGDGSGFKAHKRKPMAVDDDGDDDADDADDKDVSFLGSVLNKLAEILQDDGKARKHSSRGR